MISFNTNYTKALATIGKIRLKKNLADSADYNRKGMRLYKMRART